MSETVLSPSYVAVLFLVVLVSTVALLGPESRYVKAFVPTLQGAPQDRATSISWRRGEAYFGRDVAEPKVFSPAPEPVLVSQPVKPKVPRNALRAPVVRAPNLLYIGKMVRAETISVFVLASGQVRVLGIGDIIDSDWKLESVGQHGLNLKHIESGHYQVVSTR